MELDSLSLWRLASELSIEDAAILIVGRDPRQAEFVFTNGWKGEWVKETVQYPGFLAVFSALKGAIRRSELKAHLVYRIHSIAQEPLDATSLKDYYALSSSDFSRDISNELHSDAEELGSPFVALLREPDWTRSTVDVEDLKSWLRSKGMTEGFFFPDTEADPDDFLDRAHDHFSPELALAVTVWLALAGQRRFPRGPKAAIDDWITNHPDAWLGDEPLGRGAKDRIAVLVNWNSKGGAPKMAD